jgi:hypothetical protein
MLDMPEPWDTAEESLTRSWNQPKEKNCVAANNDERSWKCGVWSLPSWFLVFHLSSSSFTMMFWYGNVFCAMIYWKYVICYVMARYGPHRLIYFEQACGGEGVECGGLNILGPQSDTIWGCRSRCGLVGGCVSLLGWALNSYT